MKDENLESNTILNKKKRFLFPFFSNFCKFETCGLDIFWQTNTTHEDLPTPRPDRSPLPPFAKHFVPIKLQRSQSKELRSRLRFWWERKKRHDLWELLTTQGDSALRLELDLSTSTIQRGCISWKNWKISFLIHFCKKLAFSGNWSIELVLWTLLCSARLSEELKMNTLLTTFLLQVLFLTDAVNSNLHFLYANKQRWLLKISADFFSCKTQSFSCFQR